MFTKFTVFASALLMASAAGAVTLDFDAADATSSQTIGFTTYSEDGYTFGVASAGPNAGAAIFDTTCTGYGANCNGDPDLVPAVQDANAIFGNVLILQDNASGKPVPNDDAEGGTITFTLLSGTAFRVTGFSAIDDEEFQVLVGGTVFGDIVHTSENQVSTDMFVTPLIQVGDSFTIRYFGSGGVDSIQLAPVPLPAGVLFLLGGLAALFGLRRRAAS